MKTEEEARKCWCPFARIGLRNGEGHVGWNRLIDEDGPTNVPMGSRCIASECMAWRWNETWPVGEVPSDRGVITKHGARVGYCGLAGKP